MRVIGELLKKDEQDWQTIVTQIDYYLKIQKKYPKLEKYFVRLTECKKQGKLSSYKMEKYDALNLFTALVDRKMEIEKIWKFVQAILEFCFKNLYINEQRPTPNNFLATNHWNRIERLEEVHEKIKDILKQKRSLPYPYRYYCLALKELLEAKSVTIIRREKDKEIVQKYNNIRELMKVIFNDRKLLKILMPKLICFIHGDLHFENILVDLNTHEFKLGDPKKVNPSDIAYDMGKIWHSVHGLYDFIHSDFYSLEILRFGKEELVFELKIGSPALEITEVDGGGSGASLIEAKTRLYGDEVEIYGEILSGLPKFLKNFSLIEKDKHWLTRTLFSEAMHFCTMLPFHFRIDIKRSIALHLRGIQLLNEFYNEHYKK